MCIGNSRLLDQVRDLVLDLVGLLTLREGPENQFPRIWYWIIAWPPAEKQGLISWTFIKIEQTRTDSDVDWL